VVVVALLAACTPVSAQRPQLVVFAAASLTDVLATLEPAYEATHDIDLVISFDASSALRAQIEAGAPASLFLSADEANAHTLADAGLTDGDPVAFTRNALTMAVSAESGVERWEDLATDGVRIVAAGEEVPIQRYAELAIEMMGALAGAPSGYAAAVRANIVSREDNVRAILAKVQLGEGDVGFVYATDARGADEVRTVPIPDAANVAATYAGVVLAGSDAMSEARVLMTWLTQEQAQAAFADAGFAPLD
jgi:molybdate transport system substrate-binding protein